MNEKQLAQQNEQQDQRLKHFGKLVKTYRKEKQDNLAHEVGVSEETISKIERGKYTSLKYDLALTICKYLEIPINELPPPIIFVCNKLLFTTLT